MPPTGPLRLELARCGSTQAEAASLAAEGAPQWSTVRADEQTAGRGRRGRHWLAAPGSALLASVVLRPSRPTAELAALSLVGGLAVCGAARALGTAALVEWPNDVVVERRKLAGVLAELVPGAVVVLGFGVNLTAAPDAEHTRRPATSLAAEGVEPPPAADVLELVLAHLRALVARFEAGGFAALADEAAALDGLRGVPLELRLADGGRARGVGDGFAADGALRLRDDEGVTRTFRSGEVARTGPGL